MVKNCLLNTCYVQDNKLALFFPSQQSVLSWQHALCKWQGWNLKWSSLINGKGRIKTNIPCKWQKTYTNYPWLTMVLCKTFLLYVVTKIICIYYKLCFAFWILMFCQASVMWSRTLMVLGSSSGRSSQSATQLQGFTTGTLNHPDHTPFWFSLSVE